MNDHPSNNHKSQIMPVKRATPRVTVATDVAVLTKRAVNAFFIQLQLPRQIDTNRLPRAIDPRPGASAVYTARVAVAS